jgi:hypothetical protein
MQPQLWHQPVYLDRAAEYLGLPWAEQVQPQAANECGTVGCLAGWMVHDAGIVRLDTTGERVIDWDAAARHGMRVAWLRELADNYGVPWDEMADQLAGLPRGHSMYAGSNRLHQLWELAEKYTEGRVRLPEELKDRVAEADAVRDAFNHDDCPEYR